MPLKQIGQLFPGWKSSGAMAASELEAESSPGFAVSTPCRLRAPGQEIGTIKEFLGHCKSEEK
jgi:hypothetical protein